MNTVTGACLILRIVHSLRTFPYGSNHLTKCISYTNRFYLSLVYINVTKQKTSYLRTLAFVASVALIMGTYIAAANKLK